jgi:hypothetical protein
MRAVTVKLLDAMRAEGYDPVPFDTGRTPEETARNVAKGTSKAKGGSMHEFGAAVDVICNKHGWSCGKAKCKFFDRLQVNAEALKLLNGTVFSMVDRPHCQGVGLRQQAAIRKLGNRPETLTQRDALVQKFLSR